MPDTRHNQPSSSAGCLTYLGVIMLHDITRHEHARDTTSPEMKGWIMRNCKTREATLIRRSTYGKKKRITELVANLLFNANYISIQDGVRIE